MAPSGALSGQKATISVEIGFFGPLLEPFSSDFRNPVPASGHVCDMADFGGIRTAGAHICENTSPPCTSVRGPPGRNVAPRGSIEPGGPFGRLPFGAGNREQIDAVSGCRSQAAQHQASHEVKVSGA